MNIPAGHGRGPGWAGMRGLLLAAGLCAILGVAILEWGDESPSSPAPPALANGPPASAMSATPVDLTAARPTVSDSPGADDLPAPRSAAGPTTLSAAVETAVTPAIATPAKTPGADRGGPGVVIDGRNGQGEEISADYPFEHHYLNVNGYRLHYLDEGEGEPLIFLHGNPAWSYLWRNVIPHLTPLGRCIVPDMIGMGFSEKPPLDEGYTYHFHLANLEQFLAELDLDRYTLVVHDWGSTLGCSLALRHPTRVRGLAISEMLGMPEAVGPPAPWNVTATNLCLAYLDERVGAKLVLELDSFIEPFLTELLVKRRLSPEEVAWYRKPYRCPEDRMAMWRWPGQVPNWPLGRTPDGLVGPPEVAEEFRRVGEFLRTSPIRKLLFYTSEGNSSPFTAKYFRDHVPNVETFDLGDGRHYVQEENPHGMGRELARWFRTLPP